MQRGKVLLMGVEAPAQVSDALLSKGFDLEEAKSPAEAALKALSWQPDVVLVADNLSPEWSELVGALEPKVPVVAMEALIGVSEDLALSSVRGKRNGNGNGSSNGNGSGNGNGNGSKTVGAPADTDTLGRVTSEDLVAALEEAMDLASTPEITHFYTKVGNKLRRVNVEDIRFIEVEGKYSAIHVGDRKYNVKASLKDLLAKLPAAGFVRVSRNFVIHIEHIDHIDTFQYTIRIGEQEIPISRTYKDNLMRHIRML